MTRPDWTTGVMPCRRPVEGAGSPVANGSGRAPGAAARIGSPSSAAETWRWLPTAGRVVRSTNYAKPCSGGRDFPQAPAGNRRGARRPEVRTLTWIPTPSTPPGSPEHWWNASCLRPIGAKACRDVDWIRTGWLPMAGDPLTRPMAGNLWPSSLPVSAGHRGRADVPDGPWDSIAGRRCSFRSGTGYAICRACASAAGKNGVRTERREG